MHMVREVICRSGRSLSNELLWRRPKMPYPSLHYRYSHDIGNVLILRLAGFWAEKGVVRWRPGPAIFTTCLSLAPVVLAASGEFAEPKPLDAAVLYIVWVSYFCPFLVVVAIAMSWSGVMVFHGLTDSLEKALTPRGRAFYNEWADVATSTPPQFILGSFLAVLAGFSVYFTEGMSGAAAPPITYVSYVSACTAGFYVGCAGYWIAAGSALSVPLTRADAMYLSPYAPANTPGVEMLGRCYRLAFYGAAVGVSLCLIPSMQWIYDVNSMQATIFKVGLFVLGVTAVMVIGLLPQWRLSRMVADSRREAFGRISTELSRLGPNAGDDPRHAYLLTWLQTVTSSKPSTVSESAIVGLLLALATAFVPYVLGWLF